MFGELPAWGIFSRHVEGLLLKDVRILSKQPDHRMPLLLLDTKQPALKDLRINNKRINLRELETPSPNHFRLPTWKP